MWANRNLDVGDVVYEDDEYHRIVRAWLATKLHKLPSEVDTMSWIDVMWVIATINEDSKRNA